MVFDTILKNAPVIGMFFERTYSYWQSNIAIANATHIVLGAGIALLAFCNRKKLGLFLIIIAAVLHLVAFFG